MKQTDNRQKQQTQLRAEKIRLEKKVFSPKGKERSEAPESHDSSAASDGTGKQEQGAPNIYHAAPKVGRNEPCPCGSGKKFKKCCLEKREA